MFLLISFCFVLFMVDFFPNIYTYQFCFVAPSLPLGQMFDIQQCRIWVNPFCAESQCIQENEINAYNPWDVCVCQFNLLPAHDLFYFIKGMRHFSRARNALSLKLHYRKKSHRRALNHVPIFRSSAPYFTAQPPSGDGWVMAIKKHGLSCFIIHWTWRWAINLQLQWMGTY